MSTTISINNPFYYGHNPLNFLEWESSAISPEAQVVRKEAGVVLDTIEHSQALFGGKSTAIFRLREVADECAEEGWDGNGAHPIDHLAIRIAERIVRALPDGIALPEFAPEPDGSVSLDWIQSPNCLFSISVGGTNRLGFAWLDGTDKGHGVAHFDGEKIPPYVLHGINAIMGYENASFRAA